MLTGPIDTVLETGKPREKRPVKLCLDCPTILPRNGKRCGPCSDAHNTAQKNARRRAANRRGI